MKRQVTFLRRQMLAAALGTAASSVVRAQPAWPAKPLRINIRVE